MNRDADTCGTPSRLPTYAKWSTREEERKRQRKYFIGRMAKNLPNMKEKHQSTHLRRSIKSK